MNNTYDTIYSLINYYEDDYLLPLNRAELEAYKENTGNDSNLLIVFYVQIMPDDFVMQLHRF